ncbi:MCE family protein [Nocardia uniformis]|uniref:MCE family protein n=1 Tax=Nocardia uniformis TaxID=53432 RepID=A0A849C369_9NOCA|nr:MlaD family protein [Nocardia uniformis]NNH70880.1 MCE family protein [Nocardia uniformis]
MTVRSALPTLATAVVAVVAGGYLCFGSLELHPLRETTDLTIASPAAAGLGVGTEVMLRGVPIGTVTSVEPTSSGASVGLGYDARFEVPSNSQLAVVNLSVLGEPVVMIQPPTSAAAAPFRDGDRVVGQVLEVPSSVPELLASIDRFLAQVDPAAVQHLVDAVEASLAGIDSQITDLGQAARLLATVMLRGQTDIATIIGNTEYITQRSAWVNPELTRAGPQAELLGAMIRKLSFAVHPFTVQTDGGRVVVDKWKPTLERLAALIAEISPAVGGVAAPLLPAAQASGAGLANINFADLLNAAMQALPGDSLRISLSIPN